ncbi:MAG TPA: hypothetical protein VNL34_02270 [Candidatus Nitrosotenuis sp.]|nr:hypothetical protein [Candidatus Nitrosotenuis sp.]
MPDESCRKCGGALELIRKCTACRKPLEQICTTCTNVILDAVHACIHNTVAKPMSNIWVMSA